MFLFKTSDASCGRRGVTIVAARRCPNFKQRLGAFCLDVSVAGARFLFVRFSYSLKVVSTPMVVVLAVQSIDPGYVLSAEWYAAPPLATAFAML